MTKDLTRGSPFKVLLQFSLPVIGGNLFQLFYTLADTVIVGRTLGTEALAAVGSTTIIIILCWMQTPEDIYAQAYDYMFVVLLCTVVGVRNFDVLRTRLEDFSEWKKTAVNHLKIGFPMEFQMSVMCIGQLAMQAAVNAIGSAAIAGYTAATKVDQLSVLMNNAFGIALSSYVAQNYGAGKYQRIR